MEPLITVHLASNRPYLWKDLYDNINKFSENLTFEIIVAGPESADFKLPINFKHIKTKNIKVPQCHEITMRNAQGKMLIFISDDNRFLEPGGLSNLYREYCDLCTSKGTDQFVLVANRQGSGRICDLLFSRAKTDHAPVVGLEGALYNRNLLSKTNRIDTRFLGVTWDSDLAMRLWESGAKILKSDKVWLEEYKFAKARLSPICNHHDIPVLHSLWVRKAEENEAVPSKDAWCYMQDNKYVVVRQRLKEFMGYTDDNILIRSQGPKSFKGLQWD